MYIRNQAPKPKLKMVKMKPEKVKCQQEKKNNRLKGVFFDACDARLAKAG